MKPRTHRRILWVVCSLLATAVLAGVSALAARLRPYWVAKYRGHGADLRNAMLVYAPLAGADLIHADLHGTNLHRANLRGADLIGADLTDADLTGTDLTNAVFRMDLVAVGNTPSTGLSGGREISKNDVRLTGARYDAETRWPAGFDPKRHGLIRRK